MWHQSMCVERRVLEDVGLQLHVKLRIASVRSAAIDAPRIHLILQLAYGPGPCPLPKERWDSGAIGEHGVGLTLETTDGAGR